MYTTIRNIIIIKTENDNGNMKNIDFSILVYSDTHSINFFEYSGETKKPEFKAINPIGRVPVIKQGDFVLNER